MAEIAQYDWDKMIAQHNLLASEPSKRKMPELCGGCIFSYSDLGYSEFKGADLIGANLKAANLFHTRLDGIVLDNVTVNEYTLFYFQLCPEEGSFIGYKKAFSIDGKAVIVKLLIPEEAKEILPQPTDAGQIW